MTREEAIQAHTEEVLRAAGCAENERIFHTNAFARGDISIEAQRRRALNLAWALCRSGPVQDGSVVAVVGAGFSGLAVATALALLRNCIVVIVESESEPLSRFKRSAYRFVSPELNVAVPLGEHSGRADDGIALFRWEAGYASQVAFRWQEEFDRFAAALPLFVFESTKCVAISRNRRSATRPLVIVLEGQKGEPKKWRLPVDLAIVATGFGPERADLGSPDYSYWSSGAPGLYQANKLREKVLVCGGGDSGLVEVLHYVLRDFSHELVPRLLAPKPHAAKVIRCGLEQTRFNEILAFDTKWDREQPPVPRSILGWYCNLKTLLLDNPDEAATLKSGLDRSLFDQVESFLRDRKIGTRTQSAGGRKCWAQIAALDEVACAELDKLARPHLAKLVARELSAIIDPVLESIFDLRKVRQLVRDDFQVTWTVPSAGPFSRNISEVNLALVWLLVKTKKVTFHAGEITPPIERTRTGWSVTFDGGKEAQIFDRVATRLGPTGCPLQGQYTPRPDRPDEESAILTPWVPLIRDPKHNYVQQAAVDINCAINKLGDALRQDCWTRASQGRQLQAVFKRGASQIMLRRPKATYDGLFAVHAASGKWDFRGFYEANKDTVPAARRVRRTTKMHGRR